MLCFIVRRPVLPTHPTFPIYTSIIRGQVFKYISREKRPELLDRFL